MNQTTKRSYDRVAENYAAAPGNITATQTNLRSAPRKVGPAPDKVTTAPPKVCAAPEKVDAAPPKVGATHSFNEREREAESCYAANRSAHAKGAALHPACVATIGVSFPGGGGWWTRVCFIDKAGLGC